MNHRISLSSSKNSKDSLSQVVTNRLTDCSYPWLDYLCNWSSFL